MLRRSASRDRSVFCSWFVRLNHYRAGNNSPAPPCCRAAWQQPAVQHHLSHRQRHEERHGTTRDAPQTKGRFHDGDEVNGEPRPTAAGTQFQKHHHWHERRQPRSHRSPEVTSSSPSACQASASKNGKTKKSAMSAADTPAPVAGRLPKRDVRAVTFVGDRLDGLKSDGTRHLPGQLRTRAQGAGVAFRQNLEGLAATTG